MKRIFPSLLLFCLPLAVLADGMVVPTIAFPAKVTIPDQRALIHFTNGVERLVIETRFNGAGTNFAWVVPLPSRPFIEEATTGLFPTLQYIFRPEIVHDVPRYYIGVLLALGFVYLLRLAAKSVSNAFAIAIVFLLLVFLASALLPALSRGRRSAGMNSTSSQEVSVLDRKLAGIFETTTITSRDSKALENWLRDNGFAISENTKPVIESYVKDGWVFVAAKIRRDKPDSETSTPHPLSFTFKTDKPVYPMRLTGVDSGPLRVDLYVFGSSRAEASHFKVESCTRPNIAHPLLHEWVGDSATATKLTATLSPAQMRKDVWINFSRMPFVEKKSRLFSRHGALVYALNLGVVVFAAGLFGVYFIISTYNVPETKLPRWIGNVIAASVVIGGLLYLSLPKIEVNLTKGRFYNYARTEQLTLCMILDNGGWQTVAEARAKLTNALASNPTDISQWLKSWDNYLIGGQIHEEDSPGNYVLRETNNQIEFVAFYNDGGEDVLGKWDLHTQH
jgi:hypothetical protein